MSTTFLNNDINIRITQLFSVKVTNAIPGSFYKGVFFKGEGEVCVVGLMFIFLLRGTKVVNFPYTNRVQE